MNKKRIEKAVNSTLSEYFDSHSTIGITPKGQIIVSQTVISERDKMVLRSILEEVAINILPPLDEEN